MKKFRNVLPVLCLLVAANSFAASYRVPAADQSVIGDVKVTSVGPTDTIITLSQNNNIGYNALESANPQLNLRQPLPVGAPVIIPAKHLLPTDARQGIVVNLPEMRMYYFPAGSNEVFTYPIGIGKLGKMIPIRNAVVTYKKENPTWTPPNDIREFNLEQGIVLPKVMPAGPDNPLGPYAIYMTIPTYLIHSTIFPESIGKRASFGCIRMYEADMTQLFPSVQRGIPITIINKPVKVGWESDELFLEAHQPLEEHSSAGDANLPGMVHALSHEAKDQAVLIDWQMVAYIAKERDGLPHSVGVKLR
ncbi:MAG: L,D-transpeptidase family protein [Gammaproteobacteria bacterium]